MLCKTAQNNVSLFLAIGAIKRQKGNRELQINLIKSHKKRKPMRVIIFCVVSAIISALILIPCLILSCIDGCKVDYHHKFQLFWREEVLDKL